MTEVCQHHWVIDPPEHPAQQGRRTVVLACDKCTETMTKITLRSARELKAELEAQ